jgi:hypothetical protein
LGDFYLQPEGIFVSDVFGWSSRLLSGFVVVSMCLGKVGDLITSFLPKRTESFGDYLARTDRWGNVIDIPDRKSLETLQEFADAETEREAEAMTAMTRPRATRAPEPSSRSLMPAGESFNERHIEILLQKRQILVRLLDDTQRELQKRLEKDTAMTRGSTAYHDLLTVLEMKYEETILERNLRHTRDLRSELETRRMEEEQLPKQPKGEGAENHVVINA